ncbi:MAG: hypothetical protein GTO45_23660 [Candidatus Aminicenantes bacterium]|nr:hypothetical protein [Candidatus Aminicenantes bacterium]NIM81755.1 hypothetical protein [Candidatus Aminicenantes bacterium]NIN21127.1 hypothetical protein [Candidatus Aminicenantes bacterium]NIN44949.1 hypothetical protein [Candidatus Aminicenantes bacterium]NIN87763.1 hypothetical protein [Candidatus Aminicenantes bacterium]
MKILIRIPIISVISIVHLVLAVSCTKHPQYNLSGKWRGTVTEKGKSTLVELSVREHQGGIEGRFKILSLTDNDVDKGMAFDIVSIEHSGDKLKFIVPITGKVDDDAIAFELSVQEDRLEGYGHELRKGSKKIPITFTRQKQN